MATPTVGNNCEHNTLDILMVCDKTGSMSVALAALSEFMKEAPEIISLVAPQVRYGCIFYGDFDSSSLAFSKEPVFIQPYTSDINIMKDFISKGSEIKKMYDSCNVNKSIDEIGMHS